MLKWEKWTDLITLLITRKDNVAQSLLFMRVSGYAKLFESHVLRHRNGSEQSLPFLRFCWNFNGYGLRRASFSLKYRPIRRGWCYLWLLHRYRPSPFGIFRHLRKFDITKLIFPRIWSIIFIKKCSKMPLCLKSRIGGCQYDQCYD